MKSAQDYATRVDNFRSYATISKDIIHRWAYRLFLDVMNFGNTTTKLKDLPLALHSTNFDIEDLRSSLSVLSIPVPVADISLEVKPFLQLMLKILELSEIGNNGHIGDNVVSIVVSTIFSYIFGDIYESISGRYQIGKRAEKFEELHNIVNKARKELTDVYRGFKQKNEIEFSECSPEGHYFELETEILDSKTLVDMFNQINHFRRHSSFIGDHFLSRNEHALLGLSMAYLLCSGRESCFQFVNSGGMQQIEMFFLNDGQDSTTITLLFLGVVERATRYTVGCETFF